MKNTTHRKTRPFDFDLRQMEVFRKVVEMESFSRAASAVFLAQASVSERIANLEQAVGTRLLDRLGRKVVPTRAGEILYKHAVLLLEMKETASLEIQDFLGMKQGEVQMGGSTIPGEYILPGIMTGFRKTYPLISIALKIADTEEIERMVIEGALELGVVGSRSENRNLLCRELWKDDLALVVPSRHEWADRDAVAPDDLGRVPFILREAGSGTLRIVEHFLRTVGVRDTLNVAARFGSSTAVKEGIKAGLGVSILSKRAVETEISAGMLKALEVEGIHMSRNFFLIRDKRRVASPPCRALSDFLMETSDV
ncbi:MAG: LysR family transcriptional regulator [Deltaproteobacteria bacterium]|nr:MAG: LysR family transcriptional regulator [Deltaproteobacteria bacterium]